MPISVNDSTGEVSFLDADGAWKPARTAVNPETKEMMAFDGSAWAKVPAKSKGVLTYIDDAVRSLASGVTFGFADEIAAGANTATGLGKGSTYEENLAAERARDKTISPAIKIPGEIAGAVGTSVALAPVTATAAAATGISKLPAFLRYIAAGGAGGAAFGAGEAEEGKRLEGAGKGGLIGAAAGGTVPYVVGGAVRAGQAIRGAVMPESGVAADLSRAITRDADTPEALAERAMKLYETRPGVATLADAGGENVRGLVERVAQTPGAGRTLVVPALSGRQKGQMGRIVGDLKELTDTQQTAVQAVEQTMAARKDAAAPLYKQAYQEGEVPIWSDTLERLSSSPSVQRAMRGAVNVWRDVAVADGFGGMNPGALVELGGNLKFLQGKVPVFPNLQFWDYTKRILDDQVSAAIRAGHNEKAKTLTSLVATLRKELDDKVPTFADARNAWAGPSKFLDAIEEGRNSILSTKISAEEMLNNLINKTDAEREAFRIGSVSALTGKMGNDAAKLGDMTKYVRSPEMRGKIAAIMPTAESADKWFSRLDFETGASELTGRALGNSATARRLAEKQDAEGIVGDLVMDALSGAHGLSLWRRMLQGSTGRIRDTLRSRTDDRLARVLTESQDASELSRAFANVGKTGLPPSETTRDAATQGFNALSNYLQAP